ncbi:hypothetical protein [Cellulomonas fimi]|uniref:hypothetical protein n=1 Tax=Cellulomonas fimi TaxID=1708 RepID=UPI0023588355|nr:hypothetical protein [Cellulomonas fimi]
MPSLADRAPSDAARRSPRVPLLGAASDAPGAEAGAAHAGAASSVGPPVPDPSGAPRVTADRLVSEHLAAALVEARALTRREADRLVVVPTTAPGRADVRGDGRATVRLDDLAGVRDGHGDVHVHIDRIDVHRAPEPPRAAPVPDRAPRHPDHAAYLDKQDRRWVR